MYKLKELKNKTKEWEKLKKARDKEEQFLINKQLKMLHNLNMNGIFSKEDRLEMQCLQKILDEILRVQEGTMRLKSWVIWVK